MTEESQQRVPRLIAFDLDYTLWDFWIDTHVTGPLKLEEGVVQDRYGTIIEFYPHVPQILTQIRAFGQTKIAVCSRTTAAALAREALSLIHIPHRAGSTEGQKMSSVPAAMFFDGMEIYPGSKITHFKQLHLKTDIPYTQMVFYDDEPRNREVESLGVTFVLVPRGLDTKTFEQGLNEWRKRNGIVETL